MRKRNRRIEIYFTDSEYEDLMKKVQAAKLTREEFCRLALRGAELKEAPPAEFYSLIMEVRKVGVHLNQILRKANSIGLLDVPLIRKSLEELYKTEDMLWKTFENEEP